MIESIIKKLIDNKETISTMESCTGGGLVNEITNIPNASKVIKFSAVTYSNEYKIRMGVCENTINTYSVYSIETAREMAKNISIFANSTYGIGITGKLNREDTENKYGENNKVYASIYSKGIYSDIYITVNSKTRKLNKQKVIKEILKKIDEILNEKNK